MITYNFNYSTCCWGLYIAGQTFRDFPGHATHRVQCRTYAVEDSLLGKKRLGTSYSNQVGGWMDGWMDGCMDGCGMIK